MSVINSSHTAVGWPEREKKWAKAHGLKCAKLSIRNVGLFLAGTPQSLIESTPDDPRWDHLKTKDHERLGLLAKLRTEAIGRRRKSIIERVASPRGWMDHGKMYFKDGQPYCLVGQPYQITLADLAELAFLCETWGLSMNISANSWYYPGETVMVQVYKKRD